MFGRSPDPKKEAAKAARESSRKAAFPGDLLEGVYTTEQIGRPYKPLGAVSVRLQTMNSPASFEEAARALLAAARSYGADAVVAVRYDSAVEHPALNMRMVTVHIYGTAVKFE